MFKETAIHIKRVLENTRNSVVVDLGSSDENFRKTVQPYIDEMIFSPLIERGCTVHYFDLKDGKDASNTGFKDHSIDIVLCCNVLEHTLKPFQILAEAYRIVKPNGLLLVDVPSMYPFHPDPIDTGLRMRGSTFMGRRGTSLLLEINPGSFNV